ncbi:ImmA/IrrE family metallo-endopeptidase [Lysinibacillus sp. 38-6]|uniref:ImmA/IrrE family metallo-endopeptidase n=1 Tax=Lysinibacillus sp. 38-6 TaxID=3385991 RepID=UPI003908AC4B
MINKENVIEIIETNKDYLQQVQVYVDKTQEIGIAFRYSPIEAIKNFLARNANLIMFPSDDLQYGGLVTYKNGRYFIHINTNQPKTYENFIWAHEFYHFHFEADKIKASHIRTFADGSSPNENERIANLFASELLINSSVLKAIFAEVRETYAGDKLENQVIRLIQTFKLPYKCLVIKLAQDGLITLDEAVDIIDYDYRNHLPSDFDNSILTPSRSVQFASLSELLNDPVVKENLRASDYQSINTTYYSHMNHLGGLRDKEKE